MSDCCPSEESHSHGKKSKKPDYLLWAGSLVVLTAYLVFWLYNPNVSSQPKLFTFTSAVFELMNQMWIGIILGMLFVGLLNFIPREMITSFLGRPGKVSGLFRATLAGVFLDLCSHGILMVGMKLYERGASLGQVMAFLIASPWNSFSLTIILFTLIGFKWTLLFILLSAAIAILSGFVFELLTRSGTLPKNPHSSTLPDDYKLFSEIKKLLRNFSFSSENIKVFGHSALVDSKMIIRWLFFGVVAASLIRTFVPAEHFHTYFGPTGIGLFLTLIAATVIEVCSEGSTPIAAELFHQAKSPGNAFAFLMTGVSTDYTEVMVIKDSMKSWKIALFLPLITVPQVVFVAYLINILTRQ